MIQLLDYETYCARNEAEWLKEPAVFCDLCSTRLEEPRFHDDDAAREFPRCLKCLLNEVESAELESA